jgi:hypothetical protein
LKLAAIAAPDRNTCTVPVWNGVECRIMVSCPAGTMIGIRPNGALTSIQTAPNGPLPSPQQNPRWCVEHAHSATALNY